MSGSFGVIGEGGILDTHEVLRPNALDKPAPDCTLCDKPATDGFWHNYRWSHHKCVKLLGTADNTLVQTINLMCGDGSNRRLWAAHDKALKAIKEACAPDSILTFLEKNGIEKTNKLFETFGGQAAVNFIKTNQFHTPEFHANL